MSRRLASLALLATGLLVPARLPAAEDRCPLPVSECLFAYQSMRDRPWIGVEVAPDTVRHVNVVQRVVPGSPAEKAGIRPGDVIERIDGQPAKDWYAGRAGWKTGGDATAIQVRRGERDVRLDAHLGTIPEDYLARVIGVHMLEGHLAYMHDPHDGEAGHDEPLTTPH